MSRKLFCQISPFTYKISVMKCCFIRNIKDLPRRKYFAETKSKEKLPVLVYKHNSLIRRKLGNVNLQLQDNKAVNLAIASPKVSGILIKPHEIFSFWHLVGECKEKYGYKTGLIINSGKADEGIGGGMCQFTNMIHWMILHSPLEIIEHHHHDGIDLFPDYGRVIPFGTGTSIMYNYLDYRFINNTDMTFQLIFHTDDKYLCGELRCDNPLNQKYHIKTEGEKFIRIGEDVFREGRVYREIIDVKTGNLIEKKLIKENHAKLMYEIDENKITK